jgi:hypothetical protein
MTTEVFLEWFRSFIIRVKERPLLLLFDGHRTHLGLDFIKEARDNRVSAIKLPAHTTGQLQPLDVSCFKSLKTHWDQQMVAYQRKNGFREISKSESVDLLCNIWQESLCVSTVLSGFRKSGVFPPNRDQYPVRILNPIALASYKAQRSLTHPGPEAVGPDMTAPLAPIQQSTPKVVVPAAATACCSHASTSAAHELHVEVSSTTTTGSQKSVSLEEVSYHWVM